VLYSSLPTVSQKIESEAVEFRFNFSKESSTKTHPQGSIDPAFENRVLDPLTVILAQLGNTPEAPFSSQRLGAHIIGNHDQHHAATLYLEKKHG
jgi:hypothetical protein